MQVQHLVALRRHQNVDALHPQNRRGAKAAAQPAQHRPVAGQPPVRDVHDLAAQRQRPAAKGRIVLAAKVQRYRVADSPRAKCGGSVGVDHRGKGRVFQPGVQHRSQQIGRIAIGTRSGVIGIIRDHQRPLGGVERCGDRTGIFDA